MNIQRGKTLNPCNTLNNLYNTFPKHITTATRKISSTSVPLQQRNHQPRPKKPCSEPELPQTCTQPSHPGQRPSPEMLQPSPQEARNGNTQPRHWIIRSTTSGSADQWVADPWINPISGLPNFLIARSADHTTCEDWITMAVREMFSFVTERPSTLLLRITILWA